MNLLPYTQKQQIAYEEWRRIIRFLGTLLSCGLFLGLVLIFPSFLQLYLQEAEFSRALFFEEEAARAAKVEDLRQTSRYLRSVAVSVRSSAGEQGRASVLLAYFLSEGAARIKVNTASTRRGGETRLEGTAANRRLLLDFEKELRNSGKFQDLSLPLADIIHQKDIKFTIQGTVKSPYAL